MRSARAVFVALAALAAVAVLGCRKEQAPSLSVIETARFARTHQTVTSGGARYVADSASEWGRGDELPPFDELRIEPEGQGYAIVPYFSASCAPNRMSTLHVATLDDVPQGIAQKCAPGRPYCAEMLVWVVRDDARIGDLVRVIAATYRRPEIAKAPPQIRYHLASEAPPRPRPDRRSVSARRAA